MRVTALSLVSCFLFVVSCTRIPTGSISDHFWTPPEEQGEHFVVLRKQWRVEGEVLNVQRDQSRRQVLILAAQDGARLNSLRLPRRTQVATTAQADQIYYDVFQDRFELIGDPVVRQGTLVTQRQGPEAHLYIHGDGTVREHSPDELPKAREVIPSKVGLLPVE